MADIPSKAPSEVRAGDTVRWTRSIADYPASAGWALGYALVGSASLHRITATADGDDFAVAVQASATTSWAAGSYKLQEFVSKGSDRHTLAVTNLRVLPDLAASGAGGADTRTHARKVLDLIEAWLERKAPTAASFQLDGRRLDNYPLADLLALRDRYRAEAKREEAAEQGLGGRRLLVRM